MKTLIFTFMKGLAMGAADVVPGVSGGTIAFITGIYERLLNAIRSIGLGTLKKLQKEGLAAAWKSIDGSFLVALFGGIFVSILSLAKLLEWTLEHYPQLLWAFFFGLIVASAIYVGKQIKSWNTSTIIALVIGIGVAFSITLLSPAEPNVTYFMIFISGAIAVCAMILPGISGGFILLLMGMYAPVLGAVSDFNIVFLAILLAGCISGLLSFSHLLSWLFEKYRDLTLAVLTGFMIGALNKVWPWQNVLSTRINSDGEEVPATYQSVLPGQFEGEPYTLFAIALIVVGFAIVFVLERTRAQNPEA
ncbi:MAG: DUF368 domain-containing protein [Bacteroidota bacterium]